MGGCVKMYFWHSSIRLPPSIPQKSFTISCLLLDKILLPLHKQGIWYALSMI